MKSFFIADILGEDDVKDIELDKEGCDDCGKASRPEKHGKHPSTKTRGDRKCDDEHEQNCLPSWRRKFTDGQTTNLEEIFLRQKYITGKERAEIAKTLGLSTKQVKTWFQNRRTKWKREKQRNAYNSDIFRQENFLPFNEDFKREVQEYVHCCELSPVPISSWGCYVMNNSLSVPVVVNGSRRL